jgi:hypothetical protein
MQISLVGKEETWGKHCLLADVMWAKWEGVTRRCDGFPNESIDLPGHADIGSEQNPQPSIIFRGAHIFSRSGHRTAPSLSSRSKCENARPQQSHGTRVFMIDKILCDQTENPIR